MSGVLNSVRNLGAIKDAAGPVGREAGSKGAQKAAITSLRWGGCLNFSPGVSGSIL